MKEMIESAIKELEEAEVIDIPDEITRKELIDEVIESIKYWAERYDRQLTEYGQYVHEVYTVAFGYGLLHCDGEDLEED